MRRTCFLPFFVVALAACGGNNAASQIAKAPEYAPKDQTKCSVKKSQAEPLVVEWPPAERGRLEAAVRSGLVAVRYEGCEMELKPYCKVRGSGYKYAPLTRKRDEVSIRDEDDLYAQLPAGAARLEAKLKTAGELHVNMTMVGRWEAARGEVRSHELDGDCDGATHVVTAMTVGAFTFSAGAGADVSGGASAFGAGAGGSSSAKRETLEQDGDDSACARATGKDSAPPDGCGALIRIEVVPVTDAERRARVEPPPRERERPQAPSTPTPTEISTATSTPTPQQGGDRGTLGTIVGWTSFSALTAGTVLGVMSTTLTTNYVGEGSNKNPDCNMTYKYCDATGLSAKSAAHTEALLADGLFVLSVLTGIVYVALPVRPAATVTKDGAAVSLGGRF